MGCDIHAMIERRTDSGWVNAGDLTISRNYFIFGILAGVRVSNLPTIDQPRGVPGCSGLPFQEFAIENQQEAPSLIYLTMVKRWNEDGHSHSFTFLDELKKVDVSDPDDPEFTFFHESPSLNSSLDKMFNFSVGSFTEWDKLIQRIEDKKEAQDSDNDIRIVYFFDN
jgi:hypothetical protein